MLVRALIVLLSVLNLGVAARWIARDPAPPPTPVQVPTGVARLQLVDEGATKAAPAPPPSPATADTQTAPVPQAVATASDITAPPPQQCFSFGPFAGEAAITAAAKLKPLVQKLSTREQATSNPAKGWRVYLPPLPSLEQAQAVAQRIGAAGFSDFLVVREGGEANSIALGRFRSESAAKKHADALNAAGFAAQIQPLGDSAGARSETWLDVVADEGFDPRRTQAVIAAAQYRRTDCPAR
jgi:sporulation related protein